MNAIEEVPVMVAGHRWWSWIHDAGYGQLVAVCEPAKTYFNRPVAGVYGFDFLRTHGLIERSDRWVTIPPALHPERVWRVVEGRAVEADALMRRFPQVPLAIDNGQGPSLPDIRTPGEVEYGYNLWTLNPGECQ